MKAALAFSLVVTALASVACAHPCDTALTYRVGRVDERFRITRGELLTALRQAETIWEDGAKRNFFSYDRDGGISVDLIYDERQKTAQENEQRKHAIDSQGSSAEQLLREIDRNKAKLKTAEREHRAAKTTLEARLAAHNRNVEQWNARGGAPPAARETLAREATELRAAASALEEQTRALNALVDHINAVTDRYNAVAEEINADIDAVNSTAGQEFKQGRFIDDAGELRIEVYEYESHDDLVHVLAHELGHALGLGHNKNPESVMYGTSATDTIRLTAEDIGALRAKCGERP